MTALEFLLTAWCTTLVVWVAVERIDPVLLARIVDALGVWL